MSCYNEETGSFLLPSAALMPLRRALLAAANEEIALGYACAQAVHDALQKDAGRMKDLRQALKQNNGRDVLLGIMDKLDPAPSYPSWSRTPRKWDDDVRDRAASLLLTYDTETRSQKYRAPRKKEAKPLAAGTLRFDVAGEASISIDPKTRKVTWDVARNNRAVERARESRLGTAFFTALNAITWTRGTGGHITRTYEHTEDAARDNGHFDSGRTLTALGPLGEAHRADQMGVSVARMRKMFALRR